MLNIDYFILERIVAEIAPQLEGAAVAKVHQPDEHCLVLRLWNGRANHKLLVRTGPTPALYLSERSLPNPFQPPRFCQLLRSRLKRLQHISLLNFERIVELGFEGEDQNYRLVCELFGARSNLYLLNKDGVLVDALHKPQTVGGRLLRRGDIYCPPEPRGGLAAGNAELRPPAALKDVEDFQDWLLRELVPMSKGQALALKLAVKQGHSISLIFREFQQAWHEGKAPAALIEVGGREELVAWPPDSLPGDRIPAGGLCSFFDRLETAPEGLAEIGLKAQYRQLISAQLKRLGKRLGQIGVQEESAAEFDDKRRSGDLLLANLHLVRKGMTRICLSDWSHDPPREIEIPLDPKLSPQENAEKLFKRYKKDKRGVEHIDRRLQETKSEIEWLEGLLLALDEAQQAEDVIEVGRELLEAGLLKLNKAEAANQRRNRSEPSLNETRSPNGLRILWGRNNRSNDHLSVRMTDRDDLWFHAHNMPGCHLVLKREGRRGELPQEDLKFAASIAAGYSRGKTDARVEVIVTEGRHVRRPKGAKPGLVTVDEYRTMLVEPLRVERADSE